MALLRASIRKIVFRPATRTTMLVVGGIFVLMFIGIGATARSMADADEIEGVAALVSFPEAYTTLVSVLAAIAAFAAASWAGALAGSEWQWNTLRSAVARGESRSRYVLVTLVAAGLLLLVGWAILFAVGVAMSMLGGTIAGIDTGNPLDPVAVGRLPLVIATGWWSGLLAATFGFSAAFIARSPVVGIVIVVAFYFGEQFATILLPPDVVQYAPITLSTKLPMAVMGSGLSADMLLPLGFITAYIVIAAAAGALYARRAEIA